MWTTLKGASNIYSSLFTENGSSCPRCCKVYVDDLAQCCDCSRGIYVVLYVDDILLLTPTVSELQNLLNTCERELQAVTAKGTGPQDRTGPQGRSRRGRDSTHRRPCGTSPQSGDPV